MKIPVALRAVFFSLVLVPVLGAFFPLFSQDDPLISSLGGEGGVRFNAEGDTPSVRTVPTGPWGDLEYYETILEPPIRMIVAAGYLAEPRDWALSIRPPGAVADLLREGGLEPSEIEILLSPSCTSVRGDQLRILPPADWIWKLDSGRRGRLYEVLSKEGINRFIAHPFTLGNDIPSSLAKLRANRFSPEFLARADSLTYKRGGENVITDIQLLYELLPTVEQRFELSQLLLRTRSLIVRMRISPNSNLAKLREYWSAGFKNKDILPLLESVSRTPGVDRLDVVHLLPATPRKYIYTYATEDMAVGSEFPDCYWTSFNFFEANEANRNLDSPTSQYIGSRWRQVQPPLRFGDLIVFSNPEGTEALHACTYVAADIVYTKNGLSLLRPFVLEPFSVVAQSYWNGGKNRVFYYRHRDAHTGNGANIAD